MTLALDQTGIVFLVLAIMMGALAEEADSRETAKTYARLGCISLALAVAFFLAPIWVHALT